MRSTLLARALLLRRGRSRRHRSTFTEWQRRCVDEPGASLMPSSGWLAGWLRVVDGEGGRTVGRGGTKMTIEVGSVWRWRGRHRCGGLKTTKHQRKARCAAKTRRDDHEIRTFRGDQNDRGRHGTTRGDDGAGSSTDTATPFAKATLLSPRAQPLPRGPDERSY